MLEIAKPADAIDATSDDLWRIVSLLLLIVGITTVMVGLFAMRLVTRPITKLLRGIDDVAKGDLSHVILSERDDEIGALATAVQRDDVLAPRVARRDRSARTRPSSRSSSGSARPRSWRRSASSPPRSRTRSARRST